ncbi:MAG TPA: hypothetical protein VE954_39050 [Oligoflexus sp.]|uniref:hypothetical protein n=1 Tax=Oligoflexus sp. TaxID=1971216 RepID=UPI002D40956B|nr:hypothetical protein [Oligoflexus sp.]HYX39140.1 hypothetical protein [Oligoflexus sp.]
MKKSWVQATLLGVCLAACQETKLDQSELSSRNPAPAPDAQDADEKVVPPVPVTGAWLVASVLEESSTNTTARSLIGVSSYYNGTKITGDRARFIVTFTAAPTANNSVTIRDASAATGEYDQLVTIEGTHLNQIHAAYKTIGVYLTITDRSDNTTDTRNTTLAEILTGAATQVNTGNSASMKTGNGKNGGGGQ